MPFTIFLLNEVLINKIFNFAMFMEYKNMVPYPGHLNSQTTGDALRKGSEAGHFHFLFKSSCSKNNFPILSYLRCFLWCQDHPMGLNVPQLMERLLCHMKTYGISTVHRIVRHQKHGWHASAKGLASMVGRWISDGGTLATAQKMKYL